MRDIDGPAPMFALAWLLLPDLPGIPHRADHRRLTQMYCHGADLERTVHHHHRILIGAITVSVLVFLGIPLIAGFLTRTIGDRIKGRDYYEATVLPKIGTGTCKTRPAKASHQSA